jgi:HlyD family secretion protein
MKLAAALLLTAVIASGWGCRARPGAASEEAAEPLRPVEIQAAVAKLQDLQPTVELVGSLMAQPEKTVELSTRVAGFVDQVLVTEGQEIAAGAELVRLDDRTAQSALAKARGACDEAAANLTLLKRGPLPAEVEQARQELKRAAQTAESLKAKYAALKPLKDANEISDVKYEEARAGLEGAEAEREMAAAKLRVVQAGTRPENIAQAAAHLRSVQADVAEQELAVALCIIKSPIAGVVMQLPVRQGMYVQPGTTIADIMDLSVLFARFKLPSAQLAQVTEGAHVVVKVLALGEMPRDGTIVRIRHEADPQTADVEAFASVDNAAKALRPNLACRILVTLPETKKTLVIPSAAVSDKDGTPVVTVIREGKAHEVPVKPGIRAADQAQILDGLSEGDLVATKGGYGLPDDCPVVVVSTSR